MKPTSQEAIADTLISLLEDYSNFLDKESSGANSIAYIHGFKYSPDQIKRGEEFREKIKEAKAAYLTRFDAPTAGDGDEKLQMLLSFIPFDEMGYQKFFHLAQQYLNELDERHHPQDVKDLIIQGMEEGAEEWKAEAENYASVLQLLVELKAIHDNPNATEKEKELYAEMKPKAWEKAKQLLKNQQAAPALLNAAGDNWISVEERKPTGKDPSDAVLVAYKYKDKYFISIGTYWKSLKEWMADNENQEVTHWQPLPSPPSATAEQDKKENL